MLGSLAHNPTLCSGSALTFLRDLLLGISCASKPFVLFALLRCQFKCFFFGGACLTFFASYCLYS